MVIISLADIKEAVGRVVLVDEIWGTATRFLQDVLQMIWTIRSDCSPQGRDEVVSHDTTHNVLITIIMSLCGLKHNVISVNIMTSSDLFLIETIHYQIKNILE